MPKLSKASDKHILKDLHPFNHPMWKNPSFYKSYETFMLNFVGKTHERYMIWAEYYNLLLKCMRNG